MSYKEIDYWLDISKIQWIESHRDKSNDKQNKQYKQLIEKCLKFSAEKDGLFDMNVPEIDKRNYDLRLLEADELVYPEKYEINDCEDAVRVF